MRRGFGWIWLVVTALIAGTASYFAYGAGWAAAIATKLPAGSAPPYYYWYGPHPWGGGFAFFGFFWFLFLLLIVFWVVRGFGRMGRWNGGGPRGHLQDRFEELHRQAHEPPAQPS